MQVLIACEESQRVCMAFRERGHEAYSCDVLDPSGGHPEWHIKEDVIPLLNGNCDFKTVDGTTHTVHGKWDMIIAFPPCTHLAVSGARHFAKKRADGRQKEGIEFFCQFLTADCNRIAIENPVNIISGWYILEHFPELAKKYDLPKLPSCRIQPYQFGDHAKKTTCLWLKGLPNLLPNKIVDPGEFYTDPKGLRFSIGASADMVRDENGKILAWNDPRTGRVRSKTFPGIARAMAEQWG